MENWRHAFWLARFELKHSKTNFIYLLLILIISIIITINALPGYVQEATLLIDFAFIFVFGLLSQGARPRIFQTKEINRGLAGSHFIVLLNQQPIRKDVIIKYRFLTYFIISIPFNVLFLIGLYGLGPVFSTDTPLGTYLIFSMIWLCFSVYIGCFQPATETGYKTKQQIILISLILGPLLAILNAILFYKVYAHGLVYWTLAMSESHPFLSLGISLFLAVSGLIFWMKRMRSKMDRYDYL